MDGFSKHFVTRQGLAVGLVDNSVQKKLQDVLINRSDPETLRTLVEHGLIQEERRADNQANNNTLVLNGSVDRIRQAVQESSVMVLSPFLKTDPQGRANENAPRKNGNGKPRRFWGRTPILYEIKPRKRIPVLTGPTETLYSTLRDAKKGMTAKELMTKHKDMTEITIRWALQALRQKGLVQSVPQPQTA